MGKAGNWNAPQIMDNQDLNNGSYSNRSYHKFLDSLANRIVYRFKQDTNQDALQST